MQINTDNVNVEFATVTVEKAREIETGNDDIDTALDNAQAHVFSGDHKRAYLIIEIVP
jgi:hypothetical protein